MGKKILRVYLAKNDTPYSAAYAKLDLPASPWELWDAMEKVRLQTDDILYMEVEVSLAPLGWIRHQPQRAQRPCRTAGGIGRGTRDRL